MVSVVVAYSWDGEVSKDSRWRALRTALRTMAEEARKRAAKSSTAGVVIEDDTLQLGDSNLPVPKNREHEVPQVRINRLRAQAGAFAWDSICERIRAADLAVVDLTPTKTNSGSTERHTSSNVWLELGVALSSKPAGRVFAVHRDSNGHEHVPSDLKGLIIGCVGDQGRAKDRSLRMAVVNVLESVLCDRMGENGFNKISSHPQRKLPALPPKRRTRLRKTLG